MEISDLKFGLPDESIGSISDLAKKMSRISLPAFDQSLYHTALNPNPQFEVDIPDFEPPFEEHFKRTEEYQNRSLELLQSISDNTATLSSILQMIAESNEKQDDMIEIVSEILAIAKAKDEEEAQSSCHNVIKKINDYAMLPESSLKLTRMALQVLQVVTALMHK